MFIPITCTLNEGGTVIFDVTDTTVDDVDEEFTLYDYFSSVVGA